MTSNDIQEKVQRFLVELYLRTQGDPAATVSMYDIGEALGMDRQNSLRTAEYLIGSGFVEIKTLSGGIGITEQGLDRAQQLGISVADDGIAFAALGDAPVLDEAGCQIVDQIAAELKSQLGEKGLDFDTLSELMADLKSIDAQLSSPKPKTAVIRECFQSIKGVLQKADDVKGLDPVKTLLGE